MLISGSNVKRFSIVSRITPSAISLKFHFYCCSYRDIKFFMLVMPYGDWLEWVIKENRKRWTKVSEKNVFDLRQIFFCPSLDALIKKVVSQKELVRRHGQE